MPKPLALLVFLLLETVLLPITIVGQILFYVTFLGVLGKKVNLSTYDPAFARWILDRLGKRKDAAAREIVYALPGVSRVATDLAFGPALWAMRTTGLTINMYDYPTYHSSGIIGAFGHRTRFFDDALLSCRDRVKQVVILGAGWDTRAYTLARRAGVRVFEVDVAEMQTHKRRALETAKLDTSHVAFVPANFNEESWLEALRREQFDPNQPTFVLMEGLTYYLNREAVEATLRTVATQLAKGSAVSFDYVGRHIAEENGPRPLFYRWLIPLTRLMGVGWVFGISTDSPAEEQLATFLGQNGLRLTRFEAVGRADSKYGLVGGLAAATNDQTGDQPSA